MMHSWRSVMTVVAVVCLVTVGCVSEWDRGMWALKADPMASATWEGLEQLGTSQTKNEGWKPKPPRFTRCFKTSLTPEEAIGAALATAEGHGWIEDESLRKRIFSLSRKKLDDYNGGLAMPSDNTWCEEYPEANFRITLHYP